MKSLPSALEREIGTRQFSALDQEVFASLSLDRNPMHMDSVAARRLLTGRPVVHGIHVLLTALEYWLSEATLVPALVDCTFNNPINVGDTVVFKQKGRGDGAVVVEASVNGLLCAKLKIAGAKSADLPGGELVEVAPAAGSSDSFFSRISIPLNEPPENHLRKQYLIRVDPTELSSYFPLVCQNIGLQHTNGILALSYFVGMVCPGLNSIFSTLSLRIDETRQGGESIRFTVDQYDERFRLFYVSLDGVLVGRLTAFLRPEPQQQSTMLEISKKVTQDEFRGVRSLVIGASRGLGEVAAKILAAGGGDVVISYAAGLSDIQRVNAEIISSSLGTSRILKLDVTSWALEAINFEAFDAIYFFATPRIGRKKAGVFVPDLFAEFIDFYSKSLYNLCVHIEAIALTRKIRIYVPSSVFIAERPEGLVEYAMAKAATEVLIEDINRNFKKVLLVTTRLPKLSTDQTSSVLKTATGDNVDALLPVIRAMVK